MKTAMPDWQSQHHDEEPRDQQRDLFGAYWAEVGPDSRMTRDGWSWCILDFDADNDNVACGDARSEADAKAAVDLWVYWNRPGFRYDVQRTARWLLSFVRLGGRAR